MLRTPCRNLNCTDVFSIQKGIEEESRHTGRKGVSLAEIEDVYTKYAHVSILAEGIPIFLMNTVGADHACVFLKERRCTIYPARPRVCRLYPFSAFPGGSGEKFR